MKGSKRDTSDTIDVERVAHTAFSHILTVTPKTQSEIIEALHVLKARVKTTIAARRITL
ncbi:hypothetical protein AB7196_05395 [Providencia rettgeri]|nr:hypothetical protein [Providencia rettgeri]MBG2926936.1 hypothetical protein [Proteus mirabilis]HCD1094145.1 hypothetical protein [Proteus mirabilis]HCD1097309.1 hypothetical protein [Proteus mirabilis]HEK0653743.1 hypothetical protein [Proteus mirabilis]